MELVSNNTINIAIYSRKSKFVEKSESTENQIKMVTEYCEKHFQQPINFIIYEDEGYSGGNVDRPAFQRMMKDLKPKNLNVVACYRLDRISRNVTDFNNLIQTLDKNNIAFVCIKEQFDTTTPMGRAMMLISAVFAQLERETIGERIRDNMNELAKTGRFVNNIAPIGYSIEKVEYNSNNDKSKTYNKLVVNDTERELVELIFQKYLELESINKVTSYLLLNGFKTRKGNNFSNASVKRILTHMAYCVADEYAYNYFVKNGAVEISNISEWNGESGVYPYRRIAEAGATAEYSEMLIVVGSHTPFISSVDWCRIQDTIIGRRNLSVRRSSTATTLLSGIVKCAKCGSYMRASSRSTTNQRFYYVCELKAKSRKQLCDVTNIRGDVFDVEFIEYLTQMLTTNDLSSLLNTDLKLSSERMQFILKQIDDKNKEIKKLNTNIKNLIFKLSMFDDNVAVEYITQEINEYHSKIKDLQNDIFELENTLEVEQNSKIYSDAILYNISKFLSDDFKNETSLLTKRMIIKSFIKTIYFDGTDFNIEFY